jgi:hypothetical protein
MVHVTQEIDFDVELCDIDTEDLIDELEGRGYSIMVDSEDSLVDLHDIYESYTLKRSDFDSKLRELFYQQLGRIA